MASMRLLCLSKEFKVAMKFRSKGVAKEETHMMTSLQVFSKVRLSKAIPFALLTFLFLGAATESAIAQIDSSKIGSDGTAYVTRVIPVPQTISPEARRVLSRPASDANVPETLSDRRSHTDEWQNRTGKLFQTMYPVKVEETSLAGVPVRVITPLNLAQTRRDHVLINLHGGGFNSDSGSLTESIPVAYLSKTKVIAVLYRLAPEHPFPAALDDAVSVYRELLKTYRPMTAPRPLVPTRKCGFEVPIASRSVQNHTGKCGCPKRKCGCHPRKCGFRQGSTV
jgi:hypothetical protein